MVANFLLQITQGIDSMVRCLTMIMLAVLVVIVITAVFYRYILSDSLTWSAEVARYLCIWVNFLAASTALRKRMHIGLGFFVQRLGINGNRICRIANEVAIILFLIIVAYLGFHLSANQMGQTSPALMIPMGIPYLAIPVSAVLMALQSMTLIIFEVLKIENGPGGQYR